MSFIAILQKDGSVNLVGVQGKTWYMELTVKDSNDNPIDVTGWVVRGQIRKSFNSPNVVAEWVCEILDPQNGKIKIYLPAATTATIACGSSPNDEESQYVYDVEAMKPDGFVLELLRGKLFVKYEVTK